jgi:hypothetical protein
MRLLRFIFPFLFVRNWHDGSWELSRVRMLLCAGLLAIVLLGLILVYVLQTPIVYVRE